MNVFPGFSWVQDLQGIINMLPKEKGLLVRNFLEIFLTIVLLEIIQVEMPPVFEKAFSPSTVPHAMSTPVLAARLSLLVQTPPTSLFLRLAPLLSLHLRLTLHLEVLLLDHLVPVFL